jgi:hypothetical protein
MLKCDSIVVVIAMVIGVFDVLSVGGFHQSGSSISGDPARNNNDPSDFLGVSYQVHAGLITIEGLAVGNALGNGRIFSVFSTHGGCSPPYI